MPQIYAELRNFPALGAGRAFKVTQGDLGRAAAMVGALPPFVTPRMRRPLLEISWRVLLVRANLTDEGGHWVRSRAYNRLDPSEKTAVSYFLGMVQAQLACKALLSISHLTHVDALLRRANYPLVGTRPDFLGVDAHNSTYVATVEAKGRTNGFDQTALTRAKQQANQVPGILNVPTTSHIASEAYFTRNGEWTVVLEDPPAAAAGGPLTVNDVLVEYYRTVIEAGRSTPEWNERDDIPSFLVPGTDMRIGLPAQIVAAWDESEAARSASQPTAGAPLVEAYKSLSADMHVAAIDPAPNAEEGSEEDSGGEATAPVDLVFIYDEVTGA